MEGLRNLHVGCLKSGRSAVSEALRARRRQANARVAWGLGFKACLGLLRGPNMV